ncbi:3-deoxy-manno-octulosonate cytidylyltransferase [Zwartia panacis]|uniref:3-deoxy-manno-octulosonate cytidylyltransferase n=1 Tax=Zwartia panacis TaxID=2683345 RepID=UPI0025B60A51|nr:3-deoxy-manno-octulosonate cytidylyltransferase [Zwartia panacis]MDN4016952.1 3-deoxy-manno-octulosonate cytidylyltransferase [Zwartia panacis]
MQPFIVIIPARQASTRLPGKMLADIAGIPMVIRVAQRAAASGATDVLIATDDQTIAEVARSFGIHTRMTSPDHSCGTDRLAETVQQLNLSDDALVVNVQGDEPLIDPALISRVASLLAQHPTAAMSTCAVSITDSTHFFNPNIVKVVCDKKGDALYFSRAPIPWDRDALADGTRVLDHGVPALQHIGLYGYRAHFLKSFPTMSRGVLERIESLEQLRALEHGYKIAVHVTDTHLGAGVDTQADLDRVRHFLQTNTSNSG